MLNSSESSCSCKTSYHVLVENTFLLRVLTSFGTVPQLLVSFLALGFPFIYLHIGHLSQRVNSSILLQIYKLESTSKTKLYIYHVIFQC